MITSDFVMGALLGGFVGLVALVAFLVFLVQSRTAPAPATAPAPGTALATAPGTALATATAPAPATTAAPAVTTVPAVPAATAAAPPVEQAKPAAPAPDLEAVKAARKQAETTRQWYEAAVKESEHLVTRLNAVVDEHARGYPGVVVPDLLHPGFRDTALDKHHRAAIDLVREAVQTTRAGIGRSARAGVRGMADEVQMYLSRLQLEIDKAFQDFPSQTPFHQKLVDIDALATWTLHSVQRLRVLTGSWPGMQRANCTLSEIVEGARGRISAYNRVDYTYLPDVGEQWVEGRVVEPITIALTELLSNATSYSSDRVGVYINKVPAGFRIVVEDAGHGMNSFQLAEAERLLSYQSELDAAGLADERKLGFAVIGRLMQDYGFRVDVSAPSGGGGVKAVCLIPNSVMSEPPAQPTSPVGAARHRLDERSPSAHRPLTATTPQGLPKRERRHEPAPAEAGGAAHEDDRPTQEAITDTRSPEDAAAGLEKLRRAFSAGLAANAIDPEGHTHA
jgi:hypothetical protein